MKKERQQVIKDLIEEYCISTQRELQYLLEQKGFVVTQATLSRDIRELKIIKQHIENGGTKYFIPSKPNMSENILHESILNIDSAGHMVVIHCHSGMAQAACASLDRIHNRNIVGTIAGDDTIFVLMRTETQAIDFVKKYQEDGGIL